MGGMVLNLRDSSDSILFWGVSEALWVLRRAAVAAKISMAFLPLFSLFLAVLCAAV